MNLVIQIKDGKTVEHPIAEENLRVLIPDLDINNPPPGYARFVRKPYPELSSYQSVESVNYVLDPVLSKELKTPVWTDEYVIRDLTEEEMIDMAAEEVRLQNEKMQLDMKAPVPPPDDGNLYVWSSGLNRWIIKPDNFDEVVNRFASELAELGLLGLTPQELENIDADKKARLQQIVDEINTIEGFEGFTF
jgi:hypothetical protein